MAQVTEEQGESGAISATTSCETAFRMIAADCSAEIDRHLATFLGSDHESGPHKARVALRRLTTAMDAFAPILRRKPTAAARARAKRLFRALGKVRDADVFLAAQTDPAPRLVRETADLRDAVRRDLRERKAVTFAPALMRDLGAGGLLREKPRGLAARAMPVGRLAAAALDAAWARAGGHGGDPAALAPAELHEFRKDMKTLRYLAEFFAPLWPAEGWPRFRQTMQDLQDDLGLLNDFANARARGHDPDPAKEVKARTRAARDWAALGAQGPFWRAP